MKKMKLLLMLTIMMVAALCVGFVSCKSESETKEPINIADAIGTWMCVESYDTTLGQTYNGLLVGAQITIKNDGTYTSTASSFGTSGTYVVNENTITARNNRNETFVVSVTIKGSRMTWEGTSSTGVKFKYTFSKE